MLAWIQGLSRESECNSFRFAFIVCADERHIRQIDPLIAGVEQFNEFELIIVNVQIAEPSQCTVRIVVDLSDRERACGGRSIHQEFGNIQRAPFIAIANASIQDRGLGKVKVRAIKVDRIWIQAATCQSRIRTI